MPITKDRLSSKPEPVSGKEPLEIREFSSLYDVAKNYTETIKKPLRKRARIMRIQMPRLKK